MKTKIFFVSLLSIIVNFGCEDETETEGTINGDYVGNWYESYFANYDGEECSGEPTTEREETSDSYFWTLNDDGSALVTNETMCSAPDNADSEWCTATWTSSGGNILISSYGITSSYTVSETQGVLQMSIVVQGQSGSQDNMTPFCQLTRFTKI
ncbi:uncharacterized protein METZ01_LOCUS499037 [marine metagenome]|uniref:Lipocalin-like domain-containing protein n=1 Tax=marine metagenome TaxID=408172 RepID=A0A383DPI7_9ZZZZ